MKFDKEKAALIAEKYSIPAATLRTWKKRGNIPDCYNQEYYLKASNKKYKFVEFLISHKQYFNFYYLQTKLNITRLTDAILERSTLNILEVKKIKKYLLKVATQKTENLLFEKSFHLTKIYSANTICNLRQKFKRGTLSEKDFNTLKNGVKFILEYSE